MSIWITNLRMALEDKQVLILHGNVRDRYMDESGAVYQGLTDLLEKIVPSLTSVRCSEILFCEPLDNDPDRRQRRVNLGATTHTGYAKASGDPELDGTPPYSDAETRSSNVAETPQDTQTGRDETLVMLAECAHDLGDPSSSRTSVIYYLDKLVSYKTSYSDSDQKRLYWLQKIIENITPSNRLVLVALQDTMVPIELYTQSPKCRVLPIPAPDKTDRKNYLKHEIGDHEHLELIADLTDGLYLRELDRLVEYLEKKSNFGSRDISRIINRFRIGEEEDRWATISIEDLRNAFEWFTENSGVKGQDEAVARVVDTLCLARAGLSGMASGTTSKPKGVLFFAGPSGVGKTFLAKKLAEFLFHTQEAFVRFDMSEFKEEHTVSKLIGSPPGYVGYERGGMLTNAIRERPFSVVLFDEIEKAHPKIMDVYLQLLDEGRLTDSRGQTVFFTETVIIFTSNLGCRTTDSRGNRIEEMDSLNQILRDSELSEQERHQSIRRHFSESVERFFLFEISRPELLNRIGSNIIPFNFIHDPHIQREIVGSHLNRIQETFEDKYRHVGYQLLIDELVVDHLVSKYGDQMAQFGGRGITNAVEVEIMLLLAREVLDAEYLKKNGCSFQTYLQDGQLAVRCT